MLSPIGHGIFLGEDMTTIQNKTPTKSSQVDFGAYQNDLTAQDTVVIGELNDAYGGLTGRVRILVEDVEDGRREVRSLDLDNRTVLKSRSNAETLLEELATNRGLGWSEIARLCRVSVSAVRKWRAGESISSDHRRALARLAAFLDLLEEIGPIVEPAGWLHMRLLERYTVRAADLYVEGRADDLLEHAQGHLDINDMLDQWNPDWRTATRSDWNILNRPDGERVLIRRE